MDGFSPGMRVRRLAWSVLLIVCVEDVVCGIRRKEDKTGTCRWTKMWGKSCVFTVSTSVLGTQIESLAHGQGGAKNDRLPGTHCEVAGCLLWREQVRNYLLS